MIVRCPYCGEEVASSEYAEHHAKCKERAKVMPLTEFMEKVEPEEVKEWKPFEIYLKKGNHYVCFWQSQVNPKFYHSTYVTRWATPPWAGYQPPMKTTGPLLDKKKLEREIAKLKKEGYVEVPKEDVYYLFW